MNFDAATIVSLIAAVGLGGIFQAIIAFFRDRKKVKGEAAKLFSETKKIDVDTQLAHLNTVIERLVSDIERVMADRDRLQNELESEQQRSGKLRMRVRELEDEIDGVRRSARETQHKCDELANRLQELVKDSQEI